MFIKKALLIIFILTQILNSSNIKTESITVHSHEHIHILDANHAHEHTHVEISPLLFHQEKTKTKKEVLKTTPYPQELDLFTSLDLSSIFRPPITLS